MRIYLIEDFKGNSPRASLTLAHRLQKGLIRAGHDVFCFSYRDIQRQYSLFHYNSFVKIIGKKAALNILVSQIRNYQPDIIIFRAAVRKLDEKMIVQAKKAAPNATIVCLSASMYSEVHPNILSCAKHANFFISTGAGRNLERYKKAGIKKCAYMPYPCDPDLEHHYQVSNEWKSDLLFTGQLDRYLPGQDPMRNELIELLIRNKGLKTWGCFGNPKICGLDYLYAISGTKIGISINTFNKIKFYHSNRFMNYIACGTMVLAKYVPDSELLFTDGEHVRYFSTKEECLELVDYYLEQEEERQKIADAGMKRAHSEFNCTAIAQDIIELITTGSYNKPWAEIF